MTSRPGALTTRSAVDGVLPAWREHEALQNEWAQMVGRWGKTREANAELAKVEQELRVLRGRMRDDLGLQRLPRLIPDLELAGQPGDLTYCYADAGPAVVGDGHQH